MNLVFKIMIFSIMLNFATGMMMLALPEVFGGVNNPNTAGLNYNPTYTDDFTGDSGLNKSINPSDRMDDTNDLFDRLLDKLTLGIYGKLLDAINKYIFGFVTVLNLTVGRFMEETLRDMVMTTMKTIITIGYIFGAIWLWTGRDLR